MGQYLRASGNTIKHVGKAHFSMWTEIFMGAPGLITKQMEREHTQMSKAHGMRAIGLMINSMAKVLKPGLRGPLTTASIR
jgi:hypothetical protein